MITSVEHSCFHKARVETHCECKTSSIAHQSSRAPIFIFMTALLTTMGHCTPVFSKSIHKHTLTLLVMPLQVEKYSYCHLLPLCDIRSKTLCGLFVIDQTQQGIVAIYKETYQKNLKCVAYCCVRLA